MGKKWIIGSIVILVLVAAIVIVGLAKSPTNTGNAIKSSDTVKEYVIKSFTEVIDEKYYPQYSIKEISVNKGDFVRIRITNTKGMHDFNIDEFNVHEETPLNEEVIIEFKADKTGNFEYYCSKPGHKQNGHWGTLKVR